MIIVGDSSKSLPIADETVDCCVTSPPYFGLRDYGISGQLGLERTPVMPLELARRCVLTGCPIGGLVLDPFCGAGTTGLAAAQNGRRFVGIELNPKFASMAKKRIGA